MYVYVYILSVSVAVGVVDRLIFGVLHSVIFASSSSCIGVSVGGVDVKIFAHSDIILCSLVVYDFCWFI